MKHMAEWIALGHVTSPPTRGRGLKLDDVAKQPTNRRVAPHAGAWIETFGRAVRAVGDRVAPHAGAWIETAWRHRSS